MSGPTRDPHGTAATGETVVPVRLVERWETAYRRYGRASALAARSPAGDRQAAREVAASSAEVATIWREMARTEGLAWWTLAALRAAADAFESQARNWQARAEYGGGSPPPGRRPVVLKRPGSDG